MKSENRWMYIGGVVLLVALVVVGYVMRGGGEDGGSDAADGGADAASDGGDQAEDGSAVAVDGSSVEERAEAGAAVEVGAVPEDTEACRGYCRSLGERGALAEGTTVEECISRLCGESDAGGAAAEPAQLPTMPSLAEPAVPEMPDDCQAQCRLLQQRRELREGTTLEDCFAALCGSEEEAE